MTALLCALVIQTPALVQVTPSNFSTAREPQLAIDADHTIYAAYGMGNSVFVSRSDDMAKSFLPPVRVSDKGQLALGMRRGPRITAFRGTITVSAVVGEQGKGRDGDLVAWKSMDRGKTWSKPAKVNDMEGSAREGLHAMAVALDGTLACVWLDLRGKGTKLYSSFSKDGGKSWSQNALVYESPSGTICQCCHPSAIFGSSSNSLWVMFRNVLDGNRDMYFTWTDNDGKKFAPARKLGRDTWAIDRCPMDGGMIAVRHGVETIWRREGTIYKDLALSDEKPIGPGRQPWLTAGTQGTYMVWMDGQRIVSQTEGYELLTLSEEGDDPVAASSPNGDLVVAAWTESGINAAVLSKTDSTSPEKREETYFSTIFRLR